MIIVRPIDIDDFADLYQLAVDSGHGFTSLPVDKKLLKALIHKSTCSFNNKVIAPSHERYLFVMEDTTSGKVVGASGIESAVGLDDAFYHYRLGTVVHSSRELNVHNTIATLSLCNDYTGTSELCSLFLSQDYRQNDNGKTLAQSRFLFMAQHPHRFAEQVIAELRGVSDENGRSPFWTWLEAHFFSLDYATADHLTGIGKKSFIAELMPKYPIYVSLLDPAAQAVIGEVHKETLPALKMLEKEGFDYRGYVDIFDAGPTVEAKITEITSIQGSILCQVVINEKNKMAFHLAANTLVNDFRASRIKVNITKKKNKHQALNIVEIQQNDAIALKVAEGDLLRIL